MSRTFRELPFLHRYQVRDPSAPPVSLTYRRRDRHVTYLNSIPSEWVNMFATRPLRRHDKREIYRCMSRDNWDDHLPGIYRRKNFPYYW